MKQTIRSIALLLVLALGMFSFWGCGGGGGSNGSDTENKGESHITWEEQILPVGVSQSIDFNAVWGRNADDVWIAGDAGTLLHWDGTSWTTVEVGTTLNLYSIWSSGPNDVYVAAGNIDAYAGCGLLHWDGNTWNTANTITISPAVPVAFYGVWGTGPTDVWSVTCTKNAALLEYGWGGIQHWDGNKWSTMESGEPALLKVWGSNASDVFFTGRIGWNYTWDGNTLCQGENATENDINGIWGSSSTNVWEVCSNGTILHWNGNYWSRNMTMDEYDFQSVWGSGSNDVWGVGGSKNNDSAIIIHWNGNAWTTVLSGDSDVDRLNGVWCSSKSDIWAVGDNGIIMHGSN